MAQTTYTLTLSLDGKHAVSVAGDDPTEIQDGLAWAKGMYLKLEAHAAEGGTPPPGEPPVCPTHEQPLHWQKGRKGYFWSCHNRNEDGSWCDFRPPVEA